MPLTIGPDANGREQVDHSRSNVGVNIGGGNGGTNLGGVVSTPIRVGTRNNGGTNAVSVDQVQSVSGGGGWTPPAATYATPSYGSSGSYYASNGGSYDYAGQLAAQQAADNNARALEEQRRLAEEQRKAAEDARNKQLRRDKDAKIAEDAREKQAKRRSQNPFSIPAESTDYYQFPADSAKNKRILGNDPAIGAKDADVIGPRTSDTVPGTLASEPFSFSTPSKYNNFASYEDILSEIDARDDARSDLLGALLGIGDVKYGEEEEAARLKRWDAEREEERTRNAQDAVQAFRDAQQRPQRELESKVKQYARLNAQRKIRDMKRPMDVGTNQMWSLLEARRMRPELAEAQRLHEQEELDQEEEAQRIADSVPGISNQDTPWTIGSEISGVTGKNAQIRKIISDETRRQSQIYGELKENEGSSEGNFKDQMNGKFLDPLDFMDSADGESLFRREMRKARNSMLQRFLNPASLRIESEYVETRKERVNGKTRTYGTLRYSDRVEAAIGAVQNLYNCSKYNVMQLVQLRGGIGIDRNGKIAKVDPNSFRLTDDQFVELCRDIVKAQITKGNPLAAVQGKPGGSGVRDDTGRYVVVAKTRCFPLGYIPNLLLQDLMADPKSPLHSRSVEEIQHDVNDQWINETYPTLCANTGGNLMFQARAIENMMRCFLTLDGKNPANWDIPNIIERQTLMALRAEEMSIDDPDLRAANEVKRQNLTDAMSRFVHRYRKSNGTRVADGRLQSAGARRQNGVGDALRGLNMLQRAAKAANIGVMISSVPEAWIANGEQNLANVLSNGMFRAMHGNVAKTHQFTPELERLSQTKEAVEARQIAESLYRLGGHDALDTYFGELDESGRSRNKLTNADFRRFLQEWGVVAEGGNVSDRIRQAFHVKPGEEMGFLSMVNNVLDGLDSMMMSGNLSKERESRQFVQMSMAEMARASIHNRESYNSSQVEAWGGIGGGEEVIRSLLQTDAGREAFMTQGITSLGRKSPIEHQMRLIMSKNGLTEFAVRTMFDRFPEYGVNKILQMIPFSNTLSYLSAKGIKSLGDLLATDNGTLGGVPNFASAMQRNANYQAGNRTSFAEGFRKNLMYDVIMGGEKLLIAGLYAGIIAFLGGVQPPDDDRDKFTWSEWKIGNDENAVPIKWAWWMDDLSGIGLPLGMAWAICEQGEWSSEAKQTATNTFINAIANFNSGTALFDAIDLVNNLDAEVAVAMGNNIPYNPSRDEWLATSLESGFWNLIGDLTPTFIGQLIPWSKDYLWRGDEDAHTASKVYNVGEGSKYSMDEAKEGYHTKDVGSYQEYMRRRRSQTNILEAMFHDWFLGPDETGYKYTEQPLDTMVDPYVMAMYDKFSLDLDDPDNGIPIDNQEEREQELYSRAETVCQWIDDHYQNAMQANLDGFVLSYDARVNCINYCYHMMDVAWDTFNENTKEWIDDRSEYEGYVKDRQDQIEHYQNLIYNYFQSDDIPWSMPRYVRQESDRETRYVDDQGNPMTFLDTLGDNAQAQAESYWYGNRPGLLPFTSPRTEDKGHNFETIPYWVVQDKNGNPVNDVAGMYDQAANLPAIAMGRNAGKDVQELLWGGQGTNMKDSTAEELRIGREGIPTLGGGAGSSGGRPWRAMEEVFPESLKNLDADTVTKMLGIPASLPKEGEDSTKKPSTNDESDNGNSSGSNRNYYNKNYSNGSYGRSYSKSYGRSYGGYSRNYSYSRGGSGSSISAYNPKIYSTAKQVYSSRASGMQTRQPYKATTTYLRPNFSTKGSREAYKRSDI